MNKKYSIYIAVSILIMLFSFPLLLKKQEKADILAGEQNEKETCPITIQVEGVTKPIDLEDYVLGVVAAEMPTSFHKEALKAQALAARTYALKTTQQGTKPIAKDVSAQVYLTKKERKQQWGKNFQKYEQKVEEAVRETAGEAIFFEDELITAMFFSTSNGQTEDAKYFSGSEIPYLKSVKSEGEEVQNPKFIDKSTFTLAEWNQKMDEKWNEERFKSLQLVRNPSGRVQKMIATNFEKDGREIREQLNLRSTDFNIAFDVEEKEVLIETVGYGHGVGMSQYGAQAYAEDGKNAHDIIQHYYTNTSIKKIENDELTCLKSS